MSGSNIFILALPQSITNTMSSMVTELSAMLVAITIFLRKRCNLSENLRITISSGIYIGQFLSRLKNREECEGRLHEKEREKGEKQKKEKSDKTHVKIPL